MEEKRVTYVVPDLKRVTVNTISIICSSGQRVTIDTYVEEDLELD